MGLTREELIVELAALGEKPFRAKQLWHWIYHQGVTDFAAMSSIAGPLRARLAERFVIGRAHEFHIVTLCLVARKNPLLFGSPGTAKTMTVDALMEHIPLTSFRTQAYKASPPEQFIGPISFKGMENDVFGNAKYSCSRR